MLALVKCVLLATSALAIDSAPYTGIQAYKNPQNYATSGAVYPIDYNDDINIKNPMVKPGSNIFFSFEQIRRDQPPQVDVREEDVGRYMYRPKPTTTMRIPEMRSEIDDYPVEAPDSRLISRKDRYPEVNTWQHVPISSTSMRPLPSSFDEFTLDISNLGHIRPEARYPPVNTWTGRTTTTTMAPLPPSPKFDYHSQDYHRSPKERSRPQHLSAPEYNPYSNQPLEEPVKQWTSEPLPSRNMEQAPTTRQPHWTEIAARSNRKPALGAPTGMQHQPTKGASRGNHKFNWEDLSLDSTPSTPTPPPMRPEPAVHPTQHRKSPPPPVPTLTPWSGDNF